jgi:hypothetical protein
MEDLRAYATTLRLNRRQIDEAMRPFVVGAQTVVDRTMAGVPVDDAMALVDATRVPRTRPSEGRVFRTKQI